VFTAICLGSKSLTVKPIANVIILLENGTEGLGRPLKRQKGLTLVHTMSSSLKVIWGLAGEQSCRLGTLGRMSLGHSSSFMVHVPCVLLLVQFPEFLVPT